MSTIVFVAVAIAAGAVCPLHMWWQRRKGRQAACCPPGSRSDELAALRARQQRLSARLAELDVYSGGERVGRSE